MLYQIYELYLLRAKDMNFLFYSRKGGQGKTTHSAAFAHYIGGKFITFDYGNGTAKNLSSLFESGKFVELKPNDEIVAYDDEDNVFDFGGYLDSRVIKIAKVADFCIVPIFYQSDLDIEPFINTVIELGKHNKNIVILINNTDREYIEDIRSAINMKFNYPIFVIPKSKYISRMPRDKKTVFHILNDKNTSILEKFTIRKTSGALKEFYDYLLKGKNND